MKTSEQLRADFLNFWTSAPRNAAQVENVSLVPNNDPTLLFVNSGMFPINPYLAGQPHPMGTRLTNFQRCLRTNYDEMLEIGDNRHTLMFEMMGVWSLGDFDKTSQIPWIMEFWVKVCGLDPKRIYVSVFGGNDVVGRDELAIETWKKAFAEYGVEAEFSEDITNIPKNLAEGETWKYRIFPYEKKKNWWQRAADAPGELGGPTSEMFYDMGKIEVEDTEYHINDDSGRFIEIGNNVFMEYRFGEDNAWHLMDKKNIDFGGGFERVVMIVQGKEDIFETDIYASILEKVSELSGKEYKVDGKVSEDTKHFRVLADHSRAATFILADGVTPGNKDQGYILRRFIRRLVRYGMKLGISTNFTKDLASAVITKLGVTYPHLTENESFVLTEIDKEETKFRQTLENGLKEISKLKTNGQGLDGKLAFYIYETYGFPFEMSLDEFGVSADKDINRITAEYEVENQHHRDQSRAGAEKKFTGGLADQSTETTRLHTAHHLLLRALQMVLGDHVKQRGSNITGERLRIDFSHTEALTPEQKAKVEEIVNAQISSELDVIRVELPREKAEQIGAEMEFGQKYPDLVSVYLIGKFSEKLLGDTSTLSTEELLGELSQSEIYSKEFCGGPHVKNTRELAESGIFRIQKVESSGSGIRRIKAVLS